MPKLPALHRARLLGGRLLFAPVAFALALALPPDARAQTLYWDTNGSTTGSSADTNATGTWNGSAANWSVASDGTAPTQAWSGGATAVFSAGANATGTFTVTATGSLSTGGLTFEEGNVTLSGGELSGAATIDVASGASAAIGSVISGGQALAKTGSGTLVLSGASTYSGGTIVSAGTLQLGNGGGVGSVTGDITNNGAIVFNRSDDYYFNGIISGTGGVTQDGYILHFTAAQAYTGPTTINSGYLVLPTTLDHGLSASTVVTIASGAGLDLSGRNQTLAGLEGAGTVYSFNSSASTLTLDVGAGQSHAFSGILGDSDPNFGLTKSGDGTQILFGANTYTGGTIVSGGTLTGNTTSLRGNITNNAAVVFDQATDGAFASVLSGSGSVAKSGSGQLTLLGNNTYSGGTTVSAGTLQLGNGGAAGSVTGHITNNGTLVFNRSDDYYFNGIISGAGGVTQDGYILRFTAAQAYTGPTTINSGYLVLPTTLDHGLSASTVVTIASGAVLDLSGRNQTLAGLEGAGTVYSFNSSASTLTLDVGAGQSHTFSGILGASDPNFGLTKSGDGTQVLSGANTYTGATEVNAGTLLLTGSLGHTAVVVASGAVLGGEGTIGATGSLTLNDGSSLLIAGATPGALTIGGNLTLNGTINVDLITAVAGQPIRVLNYGGSLTGSAANFRTSQVRNPVFSTDTAHQIDLVFDIKALTWSGGTAAWDINTSANWNAGADTFYQGDTVTFDDTGTNRNVQVDAMLAPTSITFSNSPGHDYTVSGSGSLSGTLVENGDGNVLIGIPIGGSGSITKAGTGTLTLTGANTYTGSTTIDEGTLQIRDGGALGTGAVVNNSALVFNRSSATAYSGAISGTGSLTQSGAGNLTLSGANTYTGGTIVSAGTLTGNTTSLQGDITNNAAVVFDQSSDGTYASVLSGTGSLTKTGAGNLTLSGANTFTGDTTIAAGGITLANAGALQNSNLTTAAGLDFGFLTSASLGALSGSQNLALGNRSAAAVTLSIGGNGASTTYSGILSGAGALAKTGAGNLTLSGANTYTGGTIVSAGTLTGNTTSLQGNITNDAAVVFDQVSDGAYAGVLSGSGSVTKTGSGTLTFTGDNTYAGGTTVSAGTLTGNTSSLQGNITDNAVIVFDQSSDGTYAGVLSGSGSLTKTGSGTLTFTGDNIHAGGTTVSAGTLQLGMGGATGSILGNVTNNGTLVFHRSGDYTFGGVISGGGGVTNDGNILRFSSAQTYTGPTAINAGILVLPTTVDNGLSASTVVTVAAGAQLDLAARNQTIAGLTGAGTVYSFGGSGSIGTLTLAVAGQQTYDFAGILGHYADSQGFGLTKSGAGTQILTGANTYTGATTIDAGTLQIGDGGATGSVASASIVNNASLVIDRSDDLTIASVISGAGSLTKSGANTLTLTGANTYTGGTAIVQGAVQLGTGGAAGSITGPIANSGTLVFNRSDDYTFSGVISGPGGVEKNGGIVRLAYAQYYTGPTVINSGALVLTTGGDQGLPASSTVTIASGARLDLSNHTLTLAGLTGGGTIYSFGGSAGSLTLDLAPGQTSHFSGSLGGSDPDFAVTKTGGGTLLLSGANTYTGPTTVAGGTLALDFSTVSADVLPSSSPLVLDGGTLTFNGAGTQALGGLTTTAGTANSIVLGANQTLNLGGLTSAGAGSSLLFDTHAGGANAGLPDIGTGIVQLSGQTAGTVISPGFAVRDSGGFGYATVNASGQVVRLTTPTELLPSSGALSTTAYTVDNNAGGPGAAGSSTLTLAASATAGAVLADTTIASGTLTLNPGVVLRNNTWNFTGTGGHAYTIAGDSTGAGLRPAAADDSIVINNYSSGTVTLASPILADGVNALVVNGTGTTNLSGASTFTGGITVNGGTLQLGDGAHALALSHAAGTMGADRTLTAGIDGTAGGIAVAVKGSASFTSLSGVTLVAGAGGSGGTGGTTDYMVGIYAGTYYSYYNGLSGGAGGAGGIGLDLQSSGAVNVSNISGGVGGTGGRGGTSALTDYLAKGLAGFGGTGGDGGAGGTGLAVNDDVTLGTIAGGAVAGGAGGAGGPGGWGNSFGTTGLGGQGGIGGDGITLGQSTTLDFQSVNGGHGGSGGPGGVQTHSGSGPLGASGSGGAGGAGIVVSNTSTVTLSAGASVSGGAGGAGGNGTAGDATSQRGTGGNGGNGASGGAGVLVYSGGSLINLGTISGGAGGAGGAGAPNENYSGNGGDGGNGGAGVRFTAGGSLINAGTIAGGSAGNAGAAGYTPTYGRGGVAGAAGSDGSGVLISGGPGTLANQSGGVINGGVVMGDFANAVTLETGSTINGDLNLGTNTGSTLTLTGSGAQLYSRAVTGATIFAGSLTKTGSGMWTLDPAFTYEGATSVDAGTLLLTGSLANSAVTVATGAAIGGDGTIGTTGGSLTLNNGSSLVVEGKTPGALTVGGNLTLNGTIDVDVRSLGTGPSIRVLNYGGSLTGSAANFSASQIRNPVFSTATAHQINLTFDTKALIWSGGTANWDIGTTANWNAGADLFYRLDQVTFDDSATNKNVVVDVAAVPGSITFSNSTDHDYTIGGSGSLSGPLTQDGDGNVTVEVPIVGANSISKSGAGNLTLAGANTYSGATTINAGALSLTGSLSGGTAISTAGTGVLSQSASGSIAGAASLTLGGAGTSLLAGANTYTGATAINSGALSLQGSLSGTAISTTGSGVLLESTSGSIAGAASLTLGGSGTSILTGTNTYTGATTINSGTLQLGAGGTTGSLSPFSAITNNGTLAINRSDTFTQGVDFAGTISGTGQVTLQGGGTLVLTGANTYTGGTTVAEGTLRIGNGGASGSVTGPIANEGTLVFYRSDDYTFNGTVSGSGGITQTGNILRFTTAQTYTGPTQIGSGALVLPSNVDNALSSSTVVTISAGAVFDLSARSQTVAGIEGGGALYSFNSTAGTLTLAVGAGQSHVFSGSVGGNYPNFGLTKTGAGTQVLAGANTYIGGTTIAGGTLQIGNGGATGSVIGNITNNGTLVFNRSGDYAFTGVVSGTGGVTHEGSILRFNAAQTYTGPTRIDSGILVLPTTVDNALSSSTVVTAAAGAKLDLSGRSQTLAGLEGGGMVYSFNSTASTLTLDIGAGQSHAFSGSLGSTDPNFGLTKSGAGTQTLSGANTYTGGTLVNAGILNLANTSGSALGTGSVTVQSGAFLTGTGSFTGALTVDAGGTLAPGNSPGLMTIGSGSIFNGTVAIQIGGLLRGADYDAIDIAGAGVITFGGTLDVSFINGFEPASGDSFDLFDFTTGTGAFATLDLPTLSSGLSWDTSSLHTNGTLSVSGSAIPEPSALAVVFGLCALAAGLVRRGFTEKRRQRS